MIKNHWIGIGRITDNLEIQKTQSGKDTLSFTLAIDKKNKKQLEQDGKPTANFIRCIAWEYTARLLQQYCSKGTKIGVAGSIETRTYKDKDGKTIFVSEVLVDEIEFLENKKENTAFQTVDDVIQPSIEITDDLLPF